jgi:hypothetical protein
VRISAICFLAALFLVNCYRAATQSIVHDEALTWQLYLIGPASAIFEVYDANNHFLATLLFRLSTALFGFSEFAMRLPTLLAGAWYFWTVIRLSLLAFPNRAIFFVAIAALSLNPILLDFLVAARGYGLAIAALFWALYQMLAYFRERDEAAMKPSARLYKAAVGLSIAVAANLTLLVPAFVLAAAFSALISRPRAPAIDATPERSGKSKSHKKKHRDDVSKTTGPGRYRDLGHFALPILGLAVVYFLAAPIETARMQDFYVGTESAWESLRNLLEASFAYNHPNAPGAWLIAVAIVMVTIVAGALFVTIRSFGRRSISELLVLLTVAAVAGSELMLGVLHLTLGLPYPVDRTGLYFVPLASLCALGLAQVLLDRGMRIPAYAAMLVCGAIAVVFALEWNTRSFWVWRYDADTKRIFDEIANRRGQEDSVRLGVSWQLEPSLNFYRTVRNAVWMKPVERDGWDGPRRFYAFIEADQGEIARRGLHVVYRGDRSGSVLAVP